MPADPVESRRFLSTEVAGGLVLLAGTVVALAWANSPWRASYHDAWSTQLGGMTLGRWVDDALMAIFFLVVGLEIKREVVHGELHDPRRAALPAVAALGGMVVPALLYAAFNAGGSGSSGWGIPMATDIAFAVGVLALVAPNAPPRLRLFLLALAIVDDIGAIVVIALFYSHDVDLQWLGVAACVVAACALLTWRAARLLVLPLLLAVGVVLWFALHEAGVHPTLAGVAVGLLAPVARLERMEHALHPWSSLVVVPVFALANAGVRLSGDQLTDALRSPVAAGVVVGLVAGKTLGITGAAWLATRLGVASLGPDLGWRAVAGTGALGGIGFTVSLFVTDLAFADAPSLAAEARLGILAASVVAAATGALLLRRRATMAGDVAAGDAGVDRPGPVHG